MRGGTQNATLIKNQNNTNIHINQLYQSRVKSIVVHKNIANNIDQDQKGITVCRKISINMTYPKYNIQLELKHIVNQKSW